VTTQPSSTTNCAGSTTSFGAVSTTAASPTYQWQFSTNSGSTWANVTNGSGGTTTNYTTVANTTNMNGYEYRCVVTDACGTVVDSSAATLTVDQPSITTASPLPSGTQNVAYSQSLASSGGSGSGYTYTKISGTLPTGITLSSGGAFSGTPTVPGTYNFTVQVQDSNGCTNSTAFSLVINCNVTISITPTSLTTTVASSYSQQLSASSGQSPYTYAVLTGTLPAGLSLSSGGLISGTPTSDATANFTVQAIDANGCPGTQAYSVTPACPTITVSGTPPAGTAGTAYSSTTFTASGANGSYTYSKTSGTLPTGLALSSGGVLSGTPTATGTFNFTVTATDTSDARAARPLLLRLAARRLLYHRRVCQSKRSTWATAQPLPLAAERGRAPSRTLEHCRRVSLLPQMDCSPAHRPWRAIIRYDHSDRYKRLHWQHGLQRCS